MTAVTMDAIHKACDTSVSCKKPRKCKKTAYWWNNEIAEIRKECYCLRRGTYRTGHSPKGEALQQFCRTKRQQLHRAIRVNQAQCKEILRVEVYNDSWNQGYRIVTRNVGVFCDLVTLDADEMGTSWTPYSVGFENDLVVVVTVLDTEQA